MQEQMAVYRSFEHSGRDAEYFIGTYPLGKL